MKFYKMDYHYEIMYKMDYHYEIMYKMYKIKMSYLKARGGYLQGRGRWVLVKATESPHHHQPMTVTVQTHPEGYQPP